MAKDDLISRAAMLEALGHFNDYVNGDPHFLNGIETATEIAENLPAVEAAPVVHARWIEYPLCLGYVGAYSEDHIVCSNCKSVWSIIDNDTERFDYCPACGAKLDGERRESDEQ